MAMGPRLLIVEDEVATWLALSLQMKTAALGLEIHRFGGCSDEFDSWYSELEPSDVAIIDLQLPSQNGIDPDGGFEVLRTLASKNPDVQAIVLTSRNDWQTYEKAKSLKYVRHYFTKPWNRGELSEAIRECLNRESRPDHQPCPAPYHGVLE
jgi:CheY-like chemotaxis protein